MRDNRGVLRVRIDLAYNGTDFVGWATQPGLRSVQGTLEEALHKLFREPLRVTVAGRTDAGVHARGQVVHVDVPETPWARLPGRSDRAPHEALVDKLNALMPRDVVVYAACIAPDGFDARFAALYRTYQYRIADSYALRDPLTADWVLWSKHPLDVDAMSRAATPLTGLRDFAAFCKPRPGATTIRELKTFMWERVTQGPDAGLVRATIVADAFCHNMVRALVGASIDVGAGLKPEEWPAQMLASKSRVNSSAVVAPHGLTLEKVAYPPHDQLAARAVAIRARRMDEEAQEHIGPLSSS
ncbi:tRNA pseudouridine(38-40) synthase TruA [Timonella sp. A28]|uniref:tRNA pseudouridine(38-40) synthase TruA n=1 Tax=Timonella sp. A28 TaxID=3442640 RepID=UPI003EB6C583